MAPVQRFRFMDAKGTIKLPVLSATGIDVGFLCYYDATDDTVKPFSAQADQATLAANQALWKDNFAGVAVTAHVAGAPAEDLTLATEGVFEFECAATAWDAFALVGADEEAGVPRGRVEHPRDRRGRADRRDRPRVEEVHGDHHPRARSHFGQPDHQYRLTTPR